jgi:integrase
LKRWLDDVVSSKAAGTLDSYKNAVDNHISKRIGGLRLDRVTPMTVQTFLAEMRRDKIGGRTQQNAFVVLRAALGHAVGLNLLSQNPCDRIDKPIHETKKIVPFTLEEAKELISETVGTRYHAVLQLAFTAGLRQGEIFGLRWDRIDFAKQTIRIDQQVVCIGGKTSIGKPKTMASIRTIEITAACSDALKSHRAIMLAEGNAGNPLAFPAREGGLIGRSTFRTRFWIPLLKSQLYAERGFHHTRHTYATLALGAGVPVTVVSKTLGHSKVDVTWNIYSHVLENHRSEATETMSRMFG